MSKEKAIELLKKSIQMSKEKTSFSYDDEGIEALELLIKEVEQKKEPTKTFEKTAKTQMKVREGIRYFEAIAEVEQEEIKRNIYKKDFDLEYHEKVVRRCNTFAEWLNELLARRDAMDDMRRALIIHKIYTDYIPEEDNNVH